MSLHAYARGNARYVTRPAFLPTPTDQCLFINREKPQRNYHMNEGKVGGGGLSMGKRLSRFHIAENMHVTRGLNTNCSRTSRVIP